MKYALLIYEREEDFVLRNDPRHAPAYWAAWPAYTKALADAGVLAGGMGLEPPNTATTVRVGENTHVVEDGPFAETEEMLGGFFLIEVANLDEALKWAARAPIRPGRSVEVRPELVMPVNAGA